MSEQFTITEAQIQQRASAKSYSRGKKYYRDDMILSPVQRENRIEARCLGSYATPYRVWAELGGSRILATGCSCEYDWGGDCKHIIALLLTYLNQPEKFKQQATFDDLLANRSREDLIDLIKDMLERYPDLQTLVERPTASEIAAGSFNLDLEAMQHEIRKELEEYSTYEYYDDYYDRYSHGQSISGTRKINEYIKTAKHYAEHGDWQSAASIYYNMLLILADMPETYNVDDDYGNPAYEIENIVAHLADCLAQGSIINDEKLRQKSLHAMLGVYFWGVNSEMYDVGWNIPDVILQYAKKEDIAGIYDSVEKAKQRHQITRHNQYVLTNYENFLNRLDILLETDPEIILKRLESQGLYDLLIQKLLELDRPSEAMTILENNITHPHELCSVLDVFIEYGHTAAAFEIAEKHATVPYTSVIVRWLMDTYETRHDRENALKWYRVYMTHEPHILIYRKIKELAQPDQWQTIRPEIITQLQTEQNYEVLTQVYLENESWHQAWKTLKKVKIHSQNRYGDIHNTLEMEVAEKARFDTPERSIEVYVRHARQYIKQRGRDNYAQAASLLAIVQELYDGMDEFETWETLIDDLRKEFKRLPALQDELNKAGL